MTPIGIIHSPFREAEGTPIQPVYAEGFDGEAELFPEYQEGLDDLAGFERIWLLYGFDRAPTPRLRVVPFRDAVARGVFSTRAPCRPNPIGLSCVRLIQVSGRRIVFSGADILDGTPLLDIKPYVPEFDAFPGARAGWLDGPGNRLKRADGRFTS
jgi:tRNA (adenine37-N6)-methyltransferase